jgi:hypothetical protein
MFLILSVYFDNVFENKIKGTSVASGLHAS